jgi:hypothetical protein
MTTNSPLIAFTGDPVPPECWYTQNQDETSRRTRGCPHLRASEPPEQPLLALRRPMETAAVGDQIRRGRWVHNNPSQLGRSQPHHKELKGQLQNWQPDRKFLILIRGYTPEKSPAF